MTEMIERVAALLMDEVKIHCGDDRCTCFSERERWDCVVRVSPEQIARSLIEAMREPTATMLEAESLQVHAVRTVVTIKGSIWRATIDAALGK